MVFQKSLVLLITPPNESLHLYFSISSFISPIISMFPSLWSPHLVAHFYFPDFCSYSRICTQKLLSLSLSLTVQSRLALDLWTLVSGSKWLELSAHASITSVSLPWIQCALLTGGIGTRKYQRLRKSQKTTQSFTSPDLYSISLPRLWIWSSSYCFHCGKL